MQTTKLLQGFHFVGIGQTGSGKSTFNNALFLEDMKDDFNKNVVRIYVNPDMERMDIYEYLNIPVVDNVEELMRLYWLNKYSHIVFNPRLEIFGGNPAQEIEYLLSSLLREKMAFMSAGYDTRECYIILDEMQRYIGDGTKSKQLSPAFKNVFTEGRKFKLFVWGFTQRLPMIHNTTFSQANIGVGYSPYERLEYFRAYNLVRPEEQYVFRIRTVGGKLFETRSYPITLSEIRDKKFKFFEKMFDENKPLPEPKTRSLWQRLRERF